MSFEKIALVGLGLIGSSLAHCGAARESGKPHRGLRAGNGRARARPAPSALRIRCMTIWRPA